METLAIPVKDAAKSLGIGRTKLYELIGGGQLQTLQIGRRRLVKTDSIRALVEKAA
ncbi:helix-turn-helix domain-containing protein [Sphingomonas hankookensis]